MRGVLCLEDGFYSTGELLNYAGETAGKVVFFTGSTGWEDVLTDPSYAGRIVMFTFPMIGTYGWPAEIEATQGSRVGGLVACDFVGGPNAAGRTMLTGVDTRRLMLHLRDFGPKMGVIAPLDGELPSQDMIARLRTAASEGGHANA